MTAHSGHYAGMTIPKWLLRLRFDLTLTEAAILAVVVVACVSALVEFAQFMGGLQ